MPQKGEWKAQACEIAWFRQFDRAAQSRGFEDLSLGQQRMY